MYDMFMGVEHNPRINEWYGHTRNMSPRRMRLVAVTS